MRNSPARTRGFVSRLRRELKLGYGRSRILRHGFWFVDIPRTSSSSIRAELGRRFGRTYGKSNTVEHEFATRQIFDDHLPAREMAELLGQDVWDSIFSFTIIRNPWDRILSMYNYRMKLGRLPSEWSFDDYVTALAATSDSSPYFSYYGHRFGLCDYVCNEREEIMIDFVARYENRAADLQAVASRLGLPSLGTLTVQAASPKGRHYSEFYTPETRRVIQRLYAKDIELFGYEFES